MLEIKTILHPTDFSPHSEYAYKLAASLARDLNAKLILLHVGEPGIDYGEIITELAWEDHRKRAEEAMRKMMSPTPPVSIEKRIEQGSPGEKIVRVAEETSTDLIVMGTHGRTGLGRLLLGSVAEQVMRKAPCPVMTVRMPAEK